MKDGSVCWRRRRFCQTCVAAVTAPGLALAASSKVRRIGVLDAGVPDPPEWLWKEAAPLRELGWVEGENLQVERRYDNGRPEAQQALAEELVRARVELIVTGASTTALAAKRATKTIPIVLYGADESVISTHVVNLARPVANVTGIGLATADVTAKALSLLKQVLPGLRRVGFLMDTGNLNVAKRAVTENVCQSLGLAPMLVDIDAVADVGGVFQRLVDWHAQALVLTGAIWPRRLEIVDNAMKRALPTMVIHDADMVREAGALMAYTWTWPELFRLRAKFIDRILRGAKTADLPVEQPNVYELVVNLKSARALGLTIPKQVLLQANELIQ